MTFAAPYAGAQAVWRRATGARQVRTPRRVSSAVGRRLIEKLRNAMRAGLRRGRSASAIRRQPRGARWCRLRRHEAVQGPESQHPSGHPHGHRAGCSEPRRGPWNLRRWQGRVERPAEGLRRARRHDGRQCAGGQPRRGDLRRRRRNPGELDLQHRLDDQAGHLGRHHDADGTGQADARRSRVGVPGRLRQAAGDLEVQRAGRHVRDAAGQDAR